VSVLATKSMPQESALVDEIVKAATNVGVQGVIATAPLRDESAMARLGVERPRVSEPQQTQPAGTRRYIYI
jgi:hypothetical protein